MLCAEVEDSKRHMVAICSEVELLNKCIANLVIGSDTHRSSASTPSAQGDGAPLIDIDIVPEFIGHTNSEPYVQSADPPRTPIPHHATSASNAMPGGMWPPQPAAALNYQGALWSWNVPPPASAVPPQPYVPYLYPGQYLHLVQAPPPPPPAVEWERGPKVKEPATFTGTDPTKLQEFLTQCLLTFNAEPRRYQKDEAQVMFAASYLTEAAASWFQPFLLASAHPSILSDWAEFVSELTQMFGDPHLASTSERKLQTLRMRDIHYVNHYIVDFMKYSSDTGWNDTAL